MARGSVSQMPAQKPNFQRVPPHPVLGNQRGWVGPTRPVPTFLPQPHLRQEEERAGQGRGLSKVGLILRQSRFSEALPAWRRCSPGAGWWWLGLSIKGPQSPWQADCFSGTLGRNGVLGIPIQHPRSLRWSTKERSCLQKPDQLHTQHNCW